MASNDDIRKAALEIFAAKGFAEATMENIAGVLGLKKQSLYSHYKSKYEILIDVIREQSAYIIGAIDETIREMEELPAGDLLKGIFIKITDVFAERSRLLLWKRMYLSLCSEEFAGLVKNIGLSYEEKLYKDLYRIIGEKHPKFTDESYFMDFYGAYFIAIQGYLDWMLIGVGNPDKLEGVWSYIWDGLKTNLTNE